MYTTVPWMTDLYRGIVYQENYHYLREMETLVCHDMLFRFHEERDGVIYIMEHEDSAVRNLAFYEIARFMELSKS